MKKISIFLVLLVSVAAFTGCNKKSISKDPSSKEAIKPVQDPIIGDFKYEYALDKYWADGYDGPYGIKVGKIMAISSYNRMILAGQPLYVAGINCYNLMTQNEDTGDANFEKVKKTIDILAQEKVPIVRFSVIPWGDKQINEDYLGNKEAYLKRLDQIATLCDEKHILLVPSLCWEITNMIKATGEYSDVSIEAWGDNTSKIFKLMLELANDMVTTLSGHKCIAMWEFGNEMNLQADIDVANYPNLPADAVQRAAREFARKCFELDPHQRLVGSGYSVMRNAQYNLYKNNSWTNDTYAQYVEITKLMTPDPMMGMSEHHYSDKRVFADLGEQSHAGQITYAKKCAGELGKVFYVGEFTGPACGDGNQQIADQLYDDFFNARVQISMIWNFTYDGSPSGADFRPGESGCTATFAKMRAINEQFKALTVPEEK